MRRLTLILALALAYGAVTAQTSKQIDFEQYTKKVEKSNAEIQDAKKSIKDATWLSRAELMLDVYEAQLLRSYMGLSTQEFPIIVGNPVSKTQEEVEGVAIDKFEMERVTFNFAGGKLESWVVTKPVVEKPLELAYESLSKVIELDTKAKRTKKVQENLIKLKNSYINEGSSYYSMKDFKNAYESFKKVTEIGQMPQVNQKDTIIYFYTALAAQLAENYENAINFYKQSLDLGFSSEGTAYYNIYEAHKSLGKADEAVNYLEVGFTKYPKNSNILFSLINHYINKGDDPSKVLTYMDKALVDDPNNATLYFAKGTVHDKLNDSEEAVKAYAKAIEIDPKFFDAHYNLGAVYFNNGVKMVEEANKIPAREVEKYDAAMAKANEEFKKALPYMEQAYGVNPNSKDVVEALKNIYFRFRGESDDMANKFKEYNEKLKNM